jgi:hypothetical protein
VWSSAWATASTTTARTMTTGDRLSSLQNLAKWAALLTMTLDHVGSVLFPEVLFLRFVGRLAWPLFALLVAVNLGARGVPVRRYLARLWLWALPAQLVFLLLGWGEFNILVTLALGVTVWGVLRGDLSPWWALTVLMAPWTQYGPLGVLLVPLLASLTLVYRVEVAWLALCALLLSQGSFFWAVGTYLAVLVTVGNVVLLALGWRWLSRTYDLPPLTVGRLPRWAGYAFYPLHLLLLVGLSAVAPAVPA